MERVRPWRRRSIEHSVFKLANLGQHDEFLRDLNCPLGCLGWQNQLQPSSTAGCRLTNCQHLQNCQWSTIVRRRHLSCCATCQWQFLNCCCQIHLLFCSVSENCSLLCPSVFGCSACFSPNKLAFYLYCLAGLKEKTMGIALHLCLIISPPDTSSGQTLWTLPLS